MTDTLPSPVNDAAGDACPDCGGTGWVGTNDRPDAGVRRCRCYDEARREQRLLAAQIPSRYHHASLDNFDVVKGMHSSLHEAKVICRNYVEAFGTVDHGLLFVGPAGVGKTHLAVAVLHDLIRKHGVVGRFADYRDLLRSIQASYNPVSQTSELEILRPILAADVLLLDELGSRRPSDWVLNTVTHILNDRYSRERITLITTNYPDDDRGRKDTVSLTHQIGEYARSRLFEMCQVVPMNGDDFRQKIRQAVWRRHR